MKPLQKTLQRDDGIKRAPVSYVENEMEIAFMFVACADLRKVMLSSSLHTHLLQFFSLFGPFLPKSIETENVHKNNWMGTR